MQILKSPVQWFGSKRTICSEVWQRFGNPDVFVDAFFGSGSILLGRPNPSGLEVVNDADGLLVNMFRSIQLAPEETAKYTCYPPSELDIIARHRWLMEDAQERVSKLKVDPHFYDPQIAGYYAYSLSAYVGGSFCDGKSYKNQEMKIPSMSSMGVHRTELDGDINKMIDYFKNLAWRLRNVKIACGDWSRVITPAVTVQHGISALAFDPPYSDSEHSVQYSGGGNVAQDVRKWCIENGDNPQYRLALFGYESPDYLMPDNWEHFSWKASGGYANQGDGRGRENAKRERIWFSPHCLKVSLFDLLTLGESDVDDVDSRNIIYTSNGQESQRYDPPTAHVLPDDDIKVSVTSISNVRTSPIEVLSKEITPLPEKQKSVKPKYSQMSIFDLMSEGEENEHPDH